MKSPTPLPLSYGQNISSNSETAPSRNSTSSCNRNYNTTAASSSVPQKSARNKLDPVCSHLLNTGLPYTLSELKALEASLLTWLSSLFLISPSAKPTSIIDVEESIKNGSVLCELAGILYKGRKVFNACKTPRSSVSALTNVRKALEGFRKLPGMSQRFLWSERELYKGDRGAILGLLEDLHRYYDGVKTDSSKPYYGVQDPMLNSSNEKAILGQSQKQSYLEISPINTRNNAGNVSTFQEELDSFIAPVPHPYPSSKTSSNALTHRDWTNSAQSNYKLNTSTASGAPPAEESKKLPNKALPGNLVAWLSSILKLGQTITVDSFKDGVLLCKLVEALEHHKIEGVDYASRAPASALHNIRKALNAVKGKNTIPMYYVYSDQEIYNGNSEIIIGLLKSIKFAYSTVKNSYTSREMTGYTERSMQSTSKIKEGNSPQKYNCKVANSFF